MCTRSKPAERLGSPLAFYRGTAYSPAMIGLRSAIAVTVLALLGGCARLGPSFRAPVAPFAEPPSDTGDLARRIEIHQPRLQTLRATLKCVARGADIKGKERFTLMLLYRAPDAVKIGADAGMIAGGVLQVTQNGGDMALYFPKDGAFYRGAASELDAHPRALNGVRPMDLVRALLVGQEVVSLLRNMPPGRELVSSTEHWGLSGQLSPTRRLAYTIRRADGLVREVGLYDLDSIQKIRIVYQAYDFFDGVLLPARAQLFFFDTGLRLDVETDKAAPNAEIPPERFSLAPPRDLKSGVMPLSVWLERVERAQAEMTRIER